MLEIIHFILHGPMQYVKQLFLIGLLSAVLACKADKTAALADSDWTLTHVEEKGKKLEVPVGAQINLAFIDGKAMGRSACNDYSSDYVQDHSKLSLFEVYATEKYCEYGNWEANYFRLLGAVEKVEWKDNNLTLKGKDDSKLYFTKRTMETLMGAQSGGKMQELLALFPELPANNRHLFSILDGSKYEQFPFVGEEMPRQFYDLLDETGGSIITQGGGAYIIGKIGKQYLMRIPGNVGVNSLAIFQEKDGKFNMLLPVVFAGKDPYRQQDAWLEDLNGDGRLDLITRLVGEDSTGKTDKLVAYLQKEDGGIDRYRGQLTASKYVMQSI
jgi:heat shock protein HslJ